MTVLVELALSESMNYFEIVLILLRWTTQIALNKKDYVNSVLLKFTHFPIQLGIKEINIEP